MNVFHCCGKIDTCQSSLTQTVKKVYFAATRGYLPVRFILWITISHQAQPLTWSRPRDIFSPGHPTRPSRRSAPVCGLSLTIQEFFESCNRPTFNVKRYSDAYRLIHAESDGIPGLIVDRYDYVLVLQSLTAGSEFWKETIAALLVEETDIQIIAPRRNIIHLLLLRRD